MKILHLIPSLDGGGAERQLCYLCRELAERGHDVHVGYLYEGPSDVKNELNGVSLHRIQVKSNYDPRIFFKILVLIRNIKPQIIQTWILQMDIIGGLAAIWSKIPWIIREPSSDNVHRSNLKYKMRYFLGRYSSQIICNSKGGMDYWGKKYSKFKLKIIPNGIPPFSKEIKDDSCFKKLHLPQGIKIIGYVGRLVDKPANKNLDSLMIAFSKVLKSFSAVLILCGDGPQRESLEQLAKKLEITDYVKFLGYLPNRNVKNLLKHFTVFISLSSFEGCPNAVIEAMASNCPLIVSDISAHREFLDPQTALLVNPNDPQATAEAILKVFSNPLSANERASNACKKSMQWSVNEMVNKYEEVYKQVTETELNIGRTD